MSHALTPMAGKPGRKPQCAAHRWSYPFALRDGKASNDMRSHFEALSVMQEGFFPLASTGFVNGSLHIGKECTDFVTEKGFRCLADGEVIAYRLDDKPLVLTYDDGRKLRYCLGFVLVRHRLGMPTAVREIDASKEAPSRPAGVAAPESAQDGVFIYSLYSYNRGLRDYAKDRDGFLVESLPFWEGSHRYRVGKRAKDEQLTATAAADTTRAAIWLPFGGVLPTPDPDDVNTPPPERHIGLRVRTRGNAHADVVGLLPRGCILTVRGTATRGWAQIDMLERGKPLPYVIGADVSETAIADGWVFLDELDSSVVPQVDDVVVLDEPCPVKAGELLGYLGDNPSSEVATVDGGPQTSSARVAIEVFAGNDFPTYLDETRRRAANLPDDEKTILVVERGAKLCRCSRHPELTLEPRHHVIPVSRSPSSGPYVYGTLYQAVPRPLTSALAVGEKTTCFRLSADGEEHVDIKAFEKLPPAEQALYPMRAVLVPVPDIGTCWGQRDHELYGRYACVWTRPPFVPSEGKAAVAFETSFSRSELDNLHESRRFVDIDGNHWWQVLVGSETSEALFAWVCEKGHPGTRWESPHAWPGFRLADGTMFEPMEALMRFVCVAGEVHPDHVESFTPVATALNTSDLVVKLEEAIDHAGTLDGKVTGDDIANARRIPWLARPLSRLICRFQSQWSHDIERWKKLSPIMDDEWKGEMIRQEKRGWWKTVAGKVDGFPADPHVHHIHPFGWVDNFSARSYRHPWITIAGTKTELVFLNRSTIEPLTSADFAEAAEKIGCDPEAIQAVAVTETSSVGAFFAPGAVHAAGDDPVPAILYERHVFHRYSHGRYDHFPDISSSKPYRKDDVPYGPSSLQYQKLLKAFALDQDAALKAASWGRFQILGMNHAACGYETVSAFVAAQSGSEKSQLASFVAFINSDKILRSAIQQREWTAFALKYNGPRQSENRYDQKMASNYESLREIRN